MESSFSARNSLFNTIYLVLYVEAQVGMCLSFKEHCTVNTSLSIIDTYICLTFLIYVKYFVRLNNGSYGNIIQL